MAATRQTTDRRIRPLEPGDRVGVIGAGPAGLTAALELCEAGATVTVFEAGDDVGGLSRTVVYNGYRFDIGGHRFFTKVRRVEDLWNNLLGDELIEVQRRSRILYDGRLFDYPLRAWNAVTGLGPWESLRIVLSYLKARTVPERSAENLEQWVCNRFGRRLYEIFFRTYTEKVWGMPCTEISAEWAAQRIRNLSLGKALLRATSLNRRSASIASLIESFRYPRLGPGQMWQACRGRIEQTGGRVLLRHRVEGIALNAERSVTLRVRTPSQAAEIHDFEHVISSMPVKHLVGALGDRVPRSLRDAGAALRYRDFIVVALIVDVPNAFPDNWLYVHAPDVRVGRVQNFKNWSSAMVPDPSRTCLGLEYFCREGDDLWSMSDEDLVRMATAEIGALDLCDPKLVIDASVVRVPKAYPVYDAAFAEAMQSVRAALDPIPNLHLVGRNGMHKYNNQDHSCLTAMLTVDSMRGARHDTWAVNTSMDYHEHQLVDSERYSSRSAEAGES